MNNIFSFYGADHKVGTTQLAQCTAEYIAKNHKDIEVLLVHSDGGRGSEYCSRVGESLDRIRPYIARSIFNPDEIKERCRYKNNLYILGGSDNPQLSAQFSPDLSESLLTAVSENFGIIIVDSGSDLETGCCLGSVCAADRVYMVMSQRESCLRRFEWMCTLFERLEIRADRFVLNYYDKRSPYEIDYIAERLNVDTSIFRTVRSSSLGTKSEQDAKSIVELKPSRGFINDISKIAKEMLEYAGVISV